MNSLTLEVEQKGSVDIMIDTSVLVSDLRLDLMLNGRRITLGDGLSFKGSSRMKGKDHLGSYEELRVVYLIEDEKREVELIIRTYDLGANKALWAYARTTDSGASGSYEVARISWIHCPVEKVLAFHFSSDPPDYGMAFAYYNPIGRGETPKGTPPPLTPYPPPPRRTDELTSSCWAYPLIVNSMDRLEGYSKVLFILNKLKGGYIMGLLPLSAHGQRGVLRYENGRIHMVFHSFLKSFSPREIPGGLLVLGSNPYEVVSLVFDAAFTLLGKGHYLRKRKPYPLPFRYLGWCSWNAYLRDVDKDKILAAIRSFKENDIPVKMFLIDDGWHSVKDGKLMAFKANSDKFPDGLEGLMADLKKEGVRYVGVWITLQGYWRGINESSELARRYPMLRGGVNKQLIADPRGLRGLSLYTDFYNYLKTSGVDFTKVDNQYDIVRYAAEVAPVTLVAEGLHKMLESAAGLYAMPILNCMAMTPDCFFYWSASNVARASIDYIPYWKDGAKKHILFCAYNSLWLSQIAWPDWDMFQSHDPYALVHALARAISGGPVYITDVPGKSDATLLKKLSLSDGRLPELEGPGLPTLDCIFRDPYNEEHPLKVFNKVHVSGWGSVGLLAAFNINAKGASVEVSTSPKELGLNVEDEYAAYEYFTERLQVLSRDSNTRPMELKELGVALYVLSPVRSWFAPIGLQEIFIMPAGIEHVEFDNKQVNVILKEKGTFVALTKGDVEVFSGTKKYEITEEELSEGTYTLRKDGLLKVRSDSRVITVKRTS